MLDGAAKLVVRFHKLIIVFWILVLVLALPLAPMFESSLTYSEDVFMPKGMESRVANGLVETHFSNLSEPGLMIVIRSSDVFSPQAKGFVFRVESELENGTHVPIRDVYGVPDLYRKILGIYWDKMNSTYRSLVENVSEGVEELNGAMWGAYDNLTSLWRSISEFRDRVNSTVYVLFYGPVVYLGLWERLVGYYRSVAPDTPISTVNGEAERMFWEKVDLNALPADYRDFARKYYSGVMLCWSRSFYPVSVSSPYIYSPRPEKRLTYCIRRAAEAAATAVGGEAGQLILDISKTFNLANWNSSTALRVFVVKTISARVPSQYRDLVDRLYDADESDLRRIILDMFEDRVPARLSKHIEEIFDLGREPSEGDLRGLAEKIAGEIFSEILDKHPPPSYPGPLPSEVLSRYVDEKNETMLLMVYFKGELDERQKIQYTGDVRGVVHSLEAEYPGVKAYVTGSAGFTADMHSTMEGDVRNIDKATVVLSIIMLLVITSSLVAPWIPLSAIGMAIMIAQALLAFIALNVMPIHYLSRSLLTVVLMGAGIDYSIYLLYRFYEEREKGTSREEAVYNTVKYAGHAIVSSGGTVMLGFGGMVLTGYRMMQSIGLSLMLGIAVTIVLVVTLVPSVLMLLGDRVFWPKKSGGKGGKRGARRRVLAKIAGFSVRRARTVVLLFFLATLVALPILTTMRRTHDVSKMLPETESKVGYNIVMDSFGPSRVSSIYVVAKFSSPVEVNGGIPRDAYTYLSEVEESIRRVDGVVDVYGPTAPAGNHSEELAEGYDRYISSDIALFIVTLRYEPTSDQAFNVIRALRRTLHPLSNDRAHIYVGGGAAEYLDISDMVDRDFAYIMAPAVVIGIFIILVFMLRSIFTPIRLIITILMSITWALAALILAAQWVYGLEIYWATPIILFTALMGLGMDYDIFLVSRIREEVDRGLEDEEAIKKSVEVTGLVITACGAIMAAAFSTLMLSSLTVLREIGFTLTLAVALDAFVVRIALVPGIMALMKKWNWWFPRLRRSQ